MNDFFNLLADFFQTRTNEELILMGIIAVLVYLFGVLVGWIVQGSKTRRYKKELLLLRKDRDEYEVRYRATETKQKALAKELEAVSKEKVAALDQLHGLRNDLGQRDVQLEELRRTNEEMGASNQELTVRVDALNAANTELEARNEQLILEAEKALESRSISDGATAGAGAGTGSNENLNAYIATSESRFQLLEQRITLLSRENESLRSAPMTAPLPSGPYTGHQPVLNPRLGASTPNGEPLLIRADTTEPGARNGQQGTEVIVQTTPSVHVPTIANLHSTQRDDLTLIDNVGPFLQQKLNEADIYRYDQIASWSEADIITYTELIGYIPGIIQRDDWVGQAKGLAMSEAAAEKRKPTTVATPVAEPFVADKGAEDNLKIVEGIGPKIEQILKASGIHTHSALADTTAERLREILNEAGSRFRSHDPKTWPVQAGLAADGKLKELKAWQGELKGGR